MSQQQAAGEAPVHTGGSVAVTIHLDGHVSDVVAFLEDNGGDPRNVGEDYIEAYVPVGLLGPLSVQPGVTRVWEIVPPEPAYGNVTSQAVTLHQAGSWHNLGLRGQGVRVGVIDLGFTGYSFLMGVELPANVVARCYTDVGVFTGNLADCEAEEEPPASTPAQCQEYVAGLYAEGEPHGTAVAEAVIDIAPDATLYVANPRSWADLQATAAWMADQGVTVINHSVGWILHGPGDGTSSISSSPLNTVDQAVARGVTWANSAGNAADNTWFGSYSDPDGNGRIGFNISNDEINPLVLRECRRYTFQLRWEDSWGGASADLDIYLWDRSTGNVLDVPAEWGYVGGVSEQSGAGNHIPLELFSIRSPINSTDVGVIVVHDSGPVPDWIQLQFWGAGGFEYHTLRGSIGTPAESANPGLLAVGAAPFYDTSDVEFFSSQGPTPDGRIKPDIVGVDCAASVTYELYTRRDNGQDCWFAGTSQASPHVAGLAALVKQRFPDFSPEEVAGYLKDNAEERGDPGPDYTWGHGFAVLPPLLGCDPVEVRADGSPVAGTWGADCLSDARTDRQARYYQFTLAESADVTVVLESDDAEPVLYLREGAGNTVGATTPGGFNDGEPAYDYHRARIETSLAAGTYTIEATTYAPGETGDFALIVSWAGLAATLSRLMANALEFDYAVGRHGGSLTHTTIGDPLTFNLAISTDSSSSAVLGPLFEGLTETSWLTNEVEPSLAESWEHSDDGLTWTFHLRDDVRWHDGTPFTAHDVEFTFNRIIYNDDIPASSRSSFTFRVPDDASGESRDEQMTVTALDDHTVQIVLPTPFAPFLRSMSTSIYPKHILEPRVDDGTFAHTWDIDADPTTVIGTGPFTIASYLPEDRVVFHRNPDYWLKDDAGNSLPYLDQIVQVIVPDLAAELAAFRAGETDSHGVLGPEYAALYPLQQAENFTIHRRGPTFGSNFLTFNMNPGLNPDTGEPFLAPEKLNWFSNRQFRQAVAHSIYKDAIINNVLHCLGYPQWASVSPAAGDFHNPDVRRYEYDIDRAKAILDGLGWVDTDDDGVREDSYGNPITFNLTTHTRGTQSQKVGAIIHRGLEDIGVGAAYRFSKFGGLVRQLTYTYDWESTVIGLTGSSEPHNGISVWHSSGSLHLWHPNQAEPATDWEAAIDDLYDRAARNWTTPGGWRFTTKPRQSPPRTSRSSTPRTRRGSRPSATCSATPPPPCTASGTSATSTGPTSAGPVD